MNSRVKVTEEEIVTVGMPANAFITVSTAEFANKVEKILRKYKDSDDNE